MTIARGTHLINRVQLPAKLNLDKSNIQELGAHHTHKNQPNICLQYCRRHRLPLNRGRKGSRYVLSVWSPLLPCVYKDNELTEHGRWFPLTLAF